MDTQNKVGLAIRQATKINEDVIEKTPQSRAAWRVMIVSLVAFITAEVGFAVARKRRAGG